MKTKHVRITSCVSYTFAICHEQILFSYKCCSWLLCHLRHNIFCISLSKQKHYKRSYLALSLSFPHCVLITLVVAMMIDCSLVGQCQYIPHPEDTHLVHGRNNQDPPLEGRRSDIPRQEHNQERILQDKKMRPPEFREATKDMKRSLKTGT